MMLPRVFWLRLHRYAGLATAAFLFFSGVTGSIIAFNDELDRALNPGVLTAAVKEGAPALPPASWIAAAEAAYPRARVSLFYGPTKPGDVVTVYLTPRMDPESTAPYPLDVEQAFLHPQTGDLLGARQRGAFRLDRLHVMPLLYQLHYSLALGKAGMWLFGIVGIIWLLDCFVALFLAWPKPTRRALREALTVKWTSSRARITYDLHRAGGLWVWTVLVIIAFSGVSMNLHEELFKPALKQVFPLTPEAYEYLPADRPAEAPMPISLERAIDAADAALRERQVKARFAGVWIENTQGFYAVRFHSDLDVIPDGAGTTVYVSGASSEVLSVRLPNGPTTGDAIRDWQYPLHSGKAFGLGGRIFVSAVGLLVAMLSATGVLIWWKKRRAARGAGRRHAMRRPA